jgi:hypothetical protein
MDESIFLLIKETQYPYGINKVSLLTKNDTNSQITGKPEAEIWLSL